MRFCELRSAENMTALICELGFLPFFSNSVPGFSVEDCCPEELWFAPDTDGPWEWKGPAARSGKCIYGKFFRGKAGFVSREWFPDFANYRRNGYDFDARYDDGLASHKDKTIMDTVQKHGTILSKELKRECGYRKGGNTGFDTVITRLQMQSYVTVADFVYSQDKFGRPYGWGIAMYTTPEEQFGRDFAASAYDKKPEKSEKRILAQLKSILPDETEENLRKFIR